MANQTRKVGPLEFRAEFEPSSLNAEKRTVELVWTTGAKVLRSSWFDGSFYEELSLKPEHVRMGRLQSGQAPLLKDHRGSTDSVIGIVESARLEKGRGVATVRFASAGVSEEADKAFALVRDGVLKNVSFGYRVYKTEKIESLDEKVPTLRAVDYEPYELSIVGIGADANAGVRNFSSEQLNECVIVTREQAMDELELKAKQEAEAKAAEQKRAAEALAIREEATRLERTRVSEIQTATRAAGLGDEFASKLVSDGTSLDEARKLVINEMAKRNAESIQTGRGSPSIQVGEADHDKFVRGVSAWCFEKAGNGLVEQAVKRGVKGFEDTAIDAGPFRGARMTDIARKCLDRAGVKHSHLYDAKKLFDLAFAQRNYAGISEFAVLFENVMYKSMRAAYAVQSDTWRRVCGVDVVSDFRSANRFMNASFGTLPVVSEHEEYRNIEIPDGSKISISTETRGGIIGVSRQALINDDMGALVDLALRFGKSAGKSIESAFYTMLAENSGLGPTMSDSQPFFHSNRANVATSAALSVAGLDADRLKMRAQMDSESNDYLDLEPRILLIPVGLESAAKVINASSFNHDSAADSTKANPVQGMFGDIVSSPRLTASTTRRYLFTEAKEAFKVVFLEGSGEGPTMETNEGFRTDGTEWKVRIDFKVNPYDPKTAVTNAGT